jgi:Family of unknown function (DUF6221)
VGDPVEALSAFLAARLDEVEARARAALEEWDDESARYEWEDLPDASFAHARWHDPARVLHEVEADRKLLALHAVEVRREERLAGYEGALEGKPPVYWENEYRCVICGWFDGEQGACETVRIRAERFSDRPDYRVEWKP